MPTYRDASVPAITGNVIDLGDGHSVAIHARQGLCWAAEFRRGRGELFDASSWFHFHAGALRHCPGRRAAALATMVPITPELREEIERLHQQASARDANLPQAAVLALSSASAAVLLHDHEDTPSSQLARRPEPARSAPMMEFPDLGDLPVPPRATPPIVLWLMFAVVVGCGAVLIWFPSPDKVQDDTVAARAEPSAQEAMTAKPTEYSSSHEGR